MLFLSYRHWTNHATAIAIAKALQAQNIFITTWIGDDQRTGNADKRMMEIERATAVVAVLTPSMVYGWSDPFDPVRAELETAFDANVAVLPVLVMGFTWEWAYEHDYVPTSLGKLPSQLSVTLDHDVTASVLAKSEFFDSYREDSEDNVGSQWIREAMPPTKNQLASENSLERAYLLGHAGDFEQSIASYTKGIEYRATPSLYVGRGQTYLSSGNSDRATKDFVKAVQTFPNDPIAYNFLGSLAEENLDFEKAVSHYSDALKVMPDNEFALLRRGVVYSRLSQTERALIDFEAVLTRFPNHADALIAKGDLLTDVDRHTEALEAFNMALLIAPRHIGGLMSRGNAQLSLGDYTSALNDFDAIVNIQRNHAKAHYNRGLIKQLQQDFSGAAVAYTRAIQIDPNYGDAYMNRGTIQRAMGHVSQAVEDYNRAIELNGNSPVALTNRANALCDIGQHQQGIRDYTRALQLDPNYVKALANRAFTYRDMGKNRKALQDFEAYLAVITNPDEKKSIAAIVRDLKKSRRWFQ